MVGGIVRPRKGIIRNFFDAYYLSVRRLSIWRLARHEGASGAVLLEEEEGDIGVCQRQFYHSNSAAALYADDRHRVARLERTRAIRLHAAEAYCCGPVKPAGDERLQTVGATAGAGRVVTTQLACLAEERCRRHRQTRRPQLLAGSNVTCVQPPASAGDSRHNEMRRCCAGLVSGDIAAWRVAGSRAAF